MTRLSLLVIAVVASLALAGAEDATSSSAATPTDAPATATHPCFCFFNLDLEQTELRCEGRDDDFDADAVDIGAVARWNCSFVRMDVSKLRLVTVGADAFTATPQLQIVILYSDYIKKIDKEAFKPLKSLVDVDLSDNSLLSVDSDLFADNTLLTSVSLSDNPLVELDQNSPILKSESITSLDLSFCKLTTLTAAMFAGLPNLQRLDISNNNIQELSLTTLQPMPSLNMLKIENNRWTCGCALKAVVDYSRFIQTSDVNRDPFAVVSCFGPGRGMDVWTSESALEYCPDDNEDNSASEEYYYDDAEALAVNAGDVTDELALDAGNLQDETEDLKLKMDDLVTATDPTEDVDEMMGGDLDEANTTLAVDSDDNDAAAVYDDDDDDDDDDDKEEEVVVIIEDEAYDDASYGGVDVSFLVLAGALAVFVAFLCVIGALVRNAVVGRRATRRGDRTALIEECRDDVQYKVVALE